MKQSELSIRADMWKQGMSVKQIAHARGVTSHAIEEYITRNRKFFPYRTKPLRQREKELARRLRDKGLKIKEIAEMLGRHPVTIGSWCK